MVHPPGGLLCGISRVSGVQVTSCSATLLSTYTNGAIQNVEIAPGSPDCRQLLELLNGETYTRQIGFVSNAQRITLEPHYALLSLRQGKIC